MSAPHVVSVDYDIIGEREGAAFYFRRNVIDYDSALDDLRQARIVNRSVTFSLIRRTTTITEERTDD